MEKDQATVRWLNLVHSSPAFVIRVGGDTESPTVLSPSSVPKSDGEYWVAGETILKNGLKIPSVFRVDTDTGGSLVGIFWKIDNKWWNFQNKPGVFAALNIAEKDAFPFDWFYFVKLEEDIFHV